jgi:preprotein translocase subunit YajC
MDTSFLTTIAPLVLVFAIFYFLIIRPQQQRAKQHRDMVENVRRGDTVVTAGGLVGRVARVKDDGEVMVDLADNVQVRVIKSTLSEVRVKGAAPDAKAEKG